jgi:hypothetical protein
MLHFTARLSHHIILRLQLSDRNSLLFSSSFISAILKCEIRVLPIDFQNISCLFLKIGYNRQSQTPSNRGTESHSSIADVES